MAAHKFIYVKMFGLVLTYASGTEREEATRQLEVLEANRAERAKRSQRKKNKTNGVDRLAQSDDEARPDSVVCYISY